MNAKTSTIGSAPIKDARVLGKPKMLILGLQHMFAMFGATVLVPILVQSYGLPLNTQTTLFFAGFGTLFFHFCTKLKVPAFLGSSFAFLGGFSAMAELSSGMYATMEPSEKLQYACGGIVIAGLLYVVLAAIIKAVGVHRVMHFLPPVVTGPIIILIGLNLAPSAVSNASSCWWLALVSMAIIIVANIWGRGMIKIIPILLGVVGGYVVALCAGMVDFSGFAGSSLLTGENAVLGLQPFLKNFSGSVAKFDLTAILVMAPIAIASMMEHIGDVSAISATVGENFIEDPGLHRTLIGDGVATALAGLFGGPANTTYGENTGVLVLSRVHDPRVVRLAAIYAIILSFSPLCPPGQHHPLRHHRRRELHPLRHDLRHRRAERGGEPRGLHQQPQPHHRCGHPGLRPGLHGRPDLPDRRGLHHPDLPGHRRHRGHRPQRHPARQRLLPGQVRQRRRRRFPGQVLRNSFVLIGNRR